MDLLSKKLKFDLENGIDNIKEYCIEQKRLVQLSVENKMKELNDLNEEFVKEIDENEGDCIKHNQKPNKIAQTE